MRTVSHGTDLQPRRASGQNQGQPPYTRSQWQGDQEDRARDSADEEEWPDKKSLIRVSSGRR